MFRNPMFRKLTAPFTLALTGVLLVGLVTGCATNRSAGEQVDDGWITTKITSKLTSDPQVNPFKIDVDTTDGVVTLRGKVKKASVRQEAEDLARNTRGVKRVINEIEVVEPGDTEGDVVSDSWITTKIKSKLTADPQLNPFNIDVDTSGGVVTLSGKVKNDANRQEAEKLARDTRGVRRVVNELTIRD